MSTEVERMVTRLVGDVSDLRSAFREGSELVAGYSSTVAKESEKVTNYAKEAAQTWALVTENREHFDAMTEAFSLMAQEALNLSSSNTAVGTTATAAAGGVTTATLSVNGFTIAELRAIAATKAFLASMGPLAAALLASQVAMQLLIEGGGALINWMVGADEEMEKLEEDARKFSESLQNQINTFGMTREQAELYKLELRGLDDATRILIQGQITQLTTMERIKQAKELAANAAKEEGEANAKLLMDLEEDVRLVGVSARDKERLLVINSKLTDSEKEYAMALLEYKFAVEDIAEENKNRLDSERELEDYLSDVYQEKIDNVREILDAAREEAETTDMSARELAIYKARREGATQADLDALNVSYDIIESKEAAKKAAKELADAEKKHQEEVQKLMEDSLTPQEEFEKRVEHLQTLLKQEGPTFLPTYEFQLKKAQEELDKSQQKLEKLKASIMNNEAVRKGSKEFYEILARAGTAVPGAVPQLTEPVVKKNNAPKPIEVDPFAEIGPFANKKYSSQTRARMRAEKEKREAAPGTFVDYSTSKDIWERIAKAVEKTAEKPSVTLEPLGLGDAGG